MKQTEKTQSLEALGWTRFFQQQLSEKEHGVAVPARVVEVQRSGLRVLTESGERQLVLGGRWYAGTAETRPTVGDWMLLDEVGAASRLLERHSVFKRVAPGGRGEIQLIAANVDVAFVVTSCNDEFNASRLERYLALAVEARVAPVVVLTKIDLTEEPEAYLDAVRAVRSDVAVELVNALELGTLDGLRAWCRTGQTLAMLGSSGVGKSTLLNTLVGAERQQTGAIREADGRGRHTTSHRSLHPLPGGGLLLDSPGMRELQIVDLEHGLAELFDDVEELTRQCRFADCAHQTEPGCAIQEALGDGRLDQRRLDNYYKLMREEARNVETVAERHQRVRRWSKQVKQRHELSHKKR